MKIRIAKKQMKKARPVWEKLGFKFKRKARIIRYMVVDGTGYIGYNHIDYGFVNMDGRMQNHYPIRIISKKTEKKKVSLM